MVAVNWLLLHAGNQSPTASPCKLQPVASDPIAGVINLYEKCYAMPVTTLNYLRCYGRAVVHLICNVKENDKASFFSLKV